MNDGLTPYQAMIVKYLEAYYQTDADVVIRRLHKRARYSDIAGMLDCSLTTLYQIRKYLGIVPDGSQIRIEYTPSYPNGTDFLKQFRHIEDAIVECRDPERLGLSVADAQKKLGVAHSTICRRTPEYLKFTYNRSR